MSALSDRLRLEACGAWGSPLGQLLNEAADRIDALEASTADEVDEAQP
jgi:hypothetical protein